MPSCPSRAIPLAARRRRMGSHPPPSPLLQARCHLHPAFPPAIAAPANCRDADEGGGGEEGSIFVGVGRRGGGRDWREAGGISSCQGSRSRERKATWGCNGVLGSLDPLCLRACVRVSPSRHGHLLGCVFFCARARLLRESGRIEPYSQRGSGEYRGGAGGGQGEGRGRRGSRREAFATLFLVACATRAAGQPQIVQSEQALQLPHPPSSPNPSSITCLCQSSLTQPRTAPA